MPDNMITQFGDMRRAISPPIGPNFRESEMRDYLQTMALIQIAQELNEIKLHLGYMASESDSAIDALKGIRHSIASLVAVDSGVAVSAKLIIGGSAMPGQVTVDTTNETVTLTFYDDKGNVTDAPAGVSVTFTSDNAAVATVASDANNPLQGDITMVAPGTANIGASISGATEPDGNPFTVSPVLITVSPGPAATAGLVLSV